MQPHQLILTMGILWLVTLGALPFLFAKARHLAYMRGHTDGKKCINATLQVRIKTLEDELADTKIQNEADTRKRLTAIASLHGTIAELEDRIMSYTGLAVTRSDYELLIGTAETLRLTERTLKALQAQQQATAAAARAEGIDGLAKRVHTQLRDTPASAGAAA
ncbi:TPA: hypothetical protein ACKP22_000924 [Pseudomonas putida]